MTRNTIAEVYDVDVKESATPTQIARVVNKAREQAKIESHIAQLEEQLKAKKRELLIICTKELPVIMSDAGMDECPLPKGYKITLDTIVTASIPSPNSDKIEDAVEKNKVGVAYMRKAAPDLLQNQITINFPIQEEKFFKKFMRDLQQRKRDVDFEVKTTVNTQRLGKWVRDQDTLGKAVDEIALNVHRIKKTVLHAPKKNVDVIKGKK